MKKDIWNHNYAYHKWIKKKSNNKNKILDVGCGDGTLVFKLHNQDNNIVGIDIDKGIIEVAKNNNKHKNIKFITGDFIETTFKEKFDAIIFVASIHHMNYEDALNKSKELLNNNGVLLIVGLSKPSSFFDWFIEIIRIIPSFIISKIKSNKTSEELNIKTNYDIPSMKYIRNSTKKILIKNYKFRYGIHYRYLLEYIKK